VKLIVQPRDGLSAFVSAIRMARKEIDLLIFRFDRPEVQKALDAAVKRGVLVRTLIAHTNKGGEKNLRKLEQKLLEVGATVARTGDEFVRYHGKMMIVDRAELWLMAFNLTALDTSGSRSFGIVTRRKAEVADALKLFEADVTRQPFSPNGSYLVVSPENSRTMLSEFVRKAKRELLIYDPKVSDGSIVKLLKERMKRGVDVRIIGKVGNNAKDLPHEKYPGKRLHTRAIVRDRRDAFVGSMSLRKLELDNRREAGIIVRNGHVVSELASTFDEDWAQTDSGRKQEKQEKEEKQESKKTEVEHAQAQA
jgi:phosphatidylserine/phosphatidylglycerophosphate/cardiolipin synthase-like enzyme